MAPVGSCEKYVITIYRFEVNCLIDISLLKMVVFSGEIACAHDHGHVVNSLIFLHSRALTSITALQYHLYSNSLNFSPSHLLIDIDLNLKFKAPIM